MAKINIVAEAAGVTMTATLNDSATTKKLLTILPVTGRAQTWGEEVYFEIPLRAPEENPHDAVPPGTVAYWPPGHAFCIFFGQTPYSPVNVLGHLDGDPQLFGRVRSGQTIRLELVREGTRKDREAPQQRR